MLPGHDPQRDPRVALPPPGTPRGHHPLPHLNRAQKEEKMRKETLGTRLGLL